MARKLSENDEDIEGDSDLSEEPGFQKRRKLSSGKDKVKRESQMRNEELDFLNCDDYEGAKSAGTNYIKPLEDGSGI